MGRHKEWRKEAKKQRRKQIRQKNAELNQKECEEREQSASYKQWKSEQEEFEAFKLQEEFRIAKENEQQWLEREKEAQERWRQLQIKFIEIKEERLRQEERIREEWKREQELLNEIKAKQLQEKEELENKQLRLKEKIEEYISFGGDIPKELTTFHETNPSKPPCPFYSKTGACRFRDSCSRNHIKPTVSTILLIPSFYSHLCLNQSTDSEYGNDIMLEYEDREMYNHFRDFYNDILPEFEKYGYVEVIEVCCNKEIHLRGNVYVEYSSVRDALKAYQVFQGRWYGGKQLSVEFCKINCWKAAICGLNFNNKCPKGSGCNFLHVFATPEHRKYKSSRNRNKDSRSWRWSESPERIVTEKENYKSSKKRKHSAGSDYEFSRKYKEHKSSLSSSSRSHKRHRKKHKN